MTPNDAIRKANQKIREHLEAAEEARHVLKQRLATDPETETVAENLRDALQAAARVAEGLVAYLATAEHRPAA